MDRKGLSHAKHHHHHRLFFGGGSKSFHVLSKTFTYYNTTLFTTFTYIMIREDDASLPGAD